MARVAVARRQGRRDSMQDRHLADVAVPGLELVAGVFDGHGGQDCAEWMRRHFGALLGKALHEEARGAPAGPAGCPAPAAARRALHRAAVAAEDHLLMRAARDGLADGTTACVAVLSRRHLHCLNVGDSRAVLRRAGRAVPLSRDHKPDDPRELRRILQAGGTVMTARHHAAGGQCPRCAAGKPRDRGRASTAWSDAPREAEEEEAATAGWLARKLGCFRRRRAAAAARGRGRTSRRGGDMFRARTKTSRIGSSVSASSSASSEDDGCSSESDLASGGAPFAPCEEHAGVARVWPGGLSVSRTLGDLPLKMTGCSVRGDGPLVASPDLSTLERTDEDELLVVASDGFWDVRTSEEAADEAATLLRQYGSEVAAEIMARRAEEDGSQDNITVLLVALA